MPPQKKAEERLYDPVIDEIGCSAGDSYPRPIRNNLGRIIGFENPDELQKD